MNFIRPLAIAAFAAAITSAAAPASAACRVKAVPGYTGGPSHIRISMRAGQKCAIPHSTIVHRGGRVRAVPTLAFHTVVAPVGGGIAVSRNVVAYGGRGPDRYGYGLTDRAGYPHTIRVTVAAR